MSGQHTPGPWVVGPVDDTIVTHLGADGRRYEIAAVDGDYNDPDQWPVMEANARLIAAAPELLALLREAAEEIQPFNRMADLSERIEAAIAKATTPTSGEAQ